MSYILQNRALIVTLPYISPPQQVILNLLLFTVFTNVATSAGIWVIKSSVVGACKLAFIAGSSAISGVKYLVKHEHKKNLAENFDSVELSVRNKTLEQENRQLKQKLEMLEKEFEIIN